MSNKTMEGKAPAGEQPESADEPHFRPRRKPPTTYQPLRLTARGAVAGITAVSFLTALLSVWIGAPLISGLGFGCASVFAALFIRRRDLLWLCVLPPTAYFAGTLLAMLAISASSDGGARGVLMSLMLLLASAAPWLFLGTAAVLVVALFRGLPQNIRRFSQELRTEAEQAVRQPGR